MGTMDRRRHFIGVVVGAAMALAACESGGASVDKAGAETIVLQFATIDGEVNQGGVAYGPQAFVDSLEEVSGGQLKVEVTTAYGDGAADAESRIIEAIAAGELDGGWPSTRAFADAGIHGLKVVEAPMTITSYEAEKALVTSPVADQLLSRLEGSGVVGLGLAMGPLRRPFAAESALLGLEDWAGTRFRVYNSPVQEDAVRALNAIPVNVGLDWGNDIRAGRLRGAELGILGFASTPLDRSDPGKVTSNVALWPKVYVLSLSQELIDSLTEEQRGWVQEAADRAMQASVDATYDETTFARKLCEQGVRFVQASSRQLSELRAAFQPVIDGLAADPDDAALLESIQGIAAEHPDTEQPDVCAQGSPTETGGAVAGAPTGTSDIPEGTYRVEITEADVANAGISNEAGLSGTWTLVIENETWALYCRTLGSRVDCGNSGNSVGELPAEAGQVRGSGDTAHLIGDAKVLSSLTGCELPPTGAPGHCDRAVLFSYAFTWTADGDTLELVDAGSPAQVYENFVIEPWTRIA